MAEIIDGKELAEKVKQRVKSAAKKLPRPAGLAVVLIGGDPASRRYMASKDKDCRECGFVSYGYTLPEDSKTDDVLSLLDRLNADPKIDGILIQMPLPEHLDTQRVLQRIDPMKDVDGVHPINVGKLSIDDPQFIPCTPAGVMEMLKEHRIPIAGKRCVVVGRSNTVGKPMSRLLLRENGTVTVCHTGTLNLGEITKEADILVTAAGVLNLITADMVKEGAVVIDIAMNRHPEGHWCGDADYAAVEKKASYITPVPGGVGPVTRSMLMQNLLHAACMHTDIDI